MYKYSVWCNVLSLWSSGACNVLQFIQTHTYCIENYVLCSVWLVYKTWMAWLMGSYPKCTNFELCFYLPTRRLYVGHVGMWHKSVLSSNGPQYFAITFFVHAAIISQRYRQDEDMVRSHLCTLFWFKRVLATSFLWPLITYRTHKVCPQLLLPNFIMMQLKVIQRKQE